MRLPSVGEVDALAVLLDRRDATAFARAGVDVNAALPDDVAVSFDASSAEVVSQQIVAISATITGSVNAATTVYLVWSGADQAWKIVGTSMPEVTE